MPFQDQVTCWHENTKVTLSFGTAKTTCLDCGLVKETRTCDKCKGTGKVELVRELCSSKFENVFPCQRYLGHTGYHIYTSSADGRSVSW